MLRGVPERFHIAVNSLAPITCLFFFRPKAIPVFDNAQGAGDAACFKSQCSCAVNTKVISISPRRKLRRLGFE